MTRTALAPDDPDPRPTASAPVGAAALPPGMVREGLRGYRQRRDALLAEAAREDIGRAGHRPCRLAGEGNEA